MMNARLAAIALVFCTAAGVFAQAQSLWSPGFSGYITGRSSLAVGDLVSVKIDTKTKLAFTSSQVSDRNLMLEFSGGSASDIMSFLPHGTSGEKSNLKTNEELDLTTMLGARVQNLDSGGHVFVQGTRTVEIGGKAETVTVSGWLDPSMLSEGRVVAFDQLADSKLVFTTALSGQKPILTQSDIARVLAAAAQAGTGAAVAPATPSGTVGSPALPPAGQPGGPVQAGGAAQAGASSQGAAAASYTVTEEKKRQLLLQYLNDMLSLIFSNTAQ
ncbi:MAG TPA: flagellar basal body L-ring protein FlgH [Spirochaetia bacterium]|nr:flagellar basal body L-ring protein FlgH [Spirochaetia bacterium]